MPDLTPVKVRGKRTGVKEEKWHYGKKRNPAKPTPLADSYSTTGIEGSLAEQPSQKRRKRRQPELSRLEQLPTEILQSIFVFSANVELPLASPHLTSQLGNPHLYPALCDAVFDLATSNSSLSIDRQDAILGRLMNSKFFSWPYFRNWLAIQAQKSGKPIAQLEQFDDPQVDHSRHISLGQAWSDITGACKFVLPPVKVFSSPLTQQNHLFLLTMVRHNRNDCEREIPEQYLVHAHRGLEAAMAAGEYLLLEAYWKLGLRPTTEHLRQAVIDAGCKRLVVRELVRRDALESPDTAGRRIDLLDPAIWSWAEKAEREGNDNGPWLRELLQHVSRKPADSDVESLRIWENVLWRL